MILPAAITQAVPIPIFMPPAITQAARFSLLQVELPGGEEINAGVLLEDLVTGRLYARLRRDWEAIAPSEAEVFSALEDALTAAAGDTGAARLLAHLEDTLSNTLRISDRREILIEDFGRALNRLYRDHVRPRVLEFVTHLPRYSLAAAAGPFLDNAEIEAQGWEEAPPGLDLRRDMFVARIAGQSMEPAIPDGSLCVFRGGVAGWRDGKLVLVEALGRGANDRYTVKRYRSVKTRNADGTWSHERIRLEPLNPDFESWDLEPEEERYRVLAEFVAVLE